MGSLVIVAIPEEDDLVWQISSEKKPHVTLAYLGDSNNPDRGKMAEFLEHAVSIGSLTRFYLEVDRRGMLGDDMADVLFFEDIWELPRLKEFRALLLKNDQIKKAYDANDQFPEWQPHLTLGYPEKPAKRMELGRRFYSVSFDRVALWDGDYEGAEFLLKRDMYYPEAVAMSSMNEARVAAGLEAIQHYGVKGMKWGVRKDRPAASPQPVSVTTKTSPTGKAKVKARGGKNQPATSDAIAKAETARKLKKSGVNALSNNELQQLATRMNLEQQVSRLSESQPKSNGAKFVKGFFQRKDKQKISLAEAAGEETAKKVKPIIAKKLAGKMAKAAAVAAV